MPGAVIAFDQVQGGPTSTGSPGVARDDLWLSGLVTARCTTSGNSTFLWELLDKPPGSGVSLSGATTANATWTPDLVGSYRIRLTTNGGGPGNVSILIAAVRFNAAGVLTERGWRFPAFGEGASENNFLGQTRGWAQALEYLLTDIRTSLKTLAAKPTVKVVAVSNVASLTGLPTIDGYTLLSGDRVLLSAQSTPSQNGIYVAAAGAWTRASDMPAGSSAAGAHVFVERGTTYADTLWYCTTNGPSDIVGTNNLAFSVFASASSDATTGSNGIVRLAGDLGGTGTTAAAPRVGSIQGTGGTCVLATDAATLQWATAATSPSLSQADNSTNSATGQALKVQAQNCTGTTSTGGQLTLSSGSGTSAAGNVALQCGGSTRLTITPTTFSAVNAIWTWLSTVVAPIIQQNTDATNGVTGDALTIQAQNCSGTTSTGGALNLTSGTGTSANGAVNLQVGGTTRFQITDQKTQWLGTRICVHDLVTELQTSSASQATAGAFTMADETLCTFDVVVCFARRTNVTKGGRYKRSVVYRRTSGGAPTIVGTLESGTDQETTAGDDVTIDVSSNDVRVRVTPADTDGRNWTAHIVVHEQLST